MSSAISAVTRPIRKAFSNPLKYAMDPGALFKDDSPEPTPVQSTGLTETERTQIAQEEADRTKRKKKATTQTTLTSPLGSTSTAKTAITKLGGA